MQKKFLGIILAICFLSFGAVIVTTPKVFAKNVYKFQTKAVKKKIKTNADKLALIDEFQEQYYAIIKRNDVLLNSEDDNILDADRKELNKLFAEVKKQISNKAYLKEYNKIEKKYSKCDEITTTGINDFAEKNYKEVDNLLNTVYEEVKLNLSPEDFNDLFISEQEWLKEVEAYKTVYDSMDFGTIGTSIYYEYQINMKSFRTLLLMMYL